MSIMTPWLERAKRGIKSKDSFQDYVNGCCLLDLPEWISEELYNEMYSAEHGIKPEIDLKHGRDIAIKSAKQGCTFNRYCKYCTNWCAKAIDKTEYKDLLIYYAIERKYGWLV